jgi:hypothetical protein
LRYKIFAILLAALITLSLTLSPLFVGAKIRDANTDRTIKLDKIKHLLDEQFLRTLNLTSQPTTINSKIEVKAPELAPLLKIAPGNNGLSYNATISDGNKTFYVTEKYLQTSNSIENQTSMYQNIIDSNKTYILNYFGQSKSTVVNNTIVNTGGSDFILKNDSSTKHMNVKIDTVDSLDLKNINSKTVLYQNFSGIYCKSSISSINPISTKSNNALPASLKIGDAIGTGQEYQIISELANGESTSFNLTIGRNLPSGSNSQESMQSSTSSDMSLDSVDPPNVLPTLGAIPPAIGTNHGWTWLACGVYVYWSAILNTQMDIVSFLASFFTPILYAMAEAVTAAIVGTGVTISIGAILAGTGPMAAILFLSIAAFTIIAGCFPADIGGIYANYEMSIAYFEEGCVFLTPTFPLPCYLEAGYYSNYYRYTAGSNRNNCTWTYFDIEDTNVSPPFGYLYNWATDGSYNHQSVLPNHLPWLLDPFVTINSYDESSGSYFNSVPVIINGLHCSETGSTVFLPPGNWTFEIPTFDGTFHYMSIDGTITYSNTATIATEEGHDFTITAYYYSHPTQSVTINTWVAYGNPGIPFSDSVYVDGNYVGDSSVTVTLPVGWHHFSYDTGIYWDGFGLPMWLYPTGADSNAKCSATDVYSGIDVEVQDIPVQVNVYFGWQF